MAAHPEGQVSRITLLLLFNISFALLLAIGLWKPRGRLTAITAPDCYPRILSAQSCPMQRTSDRWLNILRPEDVWRCCHIRWDLTACLHSGNQVPPSVSWLRGVEVYTVDKGVIGRWRHHLIALICIERVRWCCLDNLEQSGPAGGQEGDRRCESGDAGMVAPSYIWGGVK